jgi:catechol 2,3-dioxygenase-like lactoylglutathione lyase family enzyme
MDSQIRYTHTNLIAKDWKNLARFYIEVFGCEPLYPERNLSGNWIDQLTNIDNVNIQGMHLKLPGFTEGGPTLEIFGYSTSAGEINQSLINRFGFGHIAFHVGNVEEVLNRVILYGGEKYGELVETEINGVGLLKVVYTKDPEGNIIEIQNWKKE